MVDDVFPQIPFFDWLTIISCSKDTHSDLIGSLHQFGPPPLLPDAASVEFQQQKWPRLPVSIAFQF